MKNVTLTCPHCLEKDKAIGNPDETNHGWAGKWHCFHCSSSGTYQMDFVVLKASDPEV
jgi:hypothetical protein